MGVHTTFVRSLDLDEWTQRQIDAMKFGGNTNAATYFRKHGMTDQYTKIDKKYKSKAAQSYKNVLGKLIEEAALKRGEGETVAADKEDSITNGTTNLMESLELADRQEQEAAAQAAAASNKTTHAVSKAVPASQLAQAKGKKLVTPPSSGNAPKLVLRKPSSSSSTGSNLLLKKKKPTKTAMKLTMKKKKDTGGNDSSDDGMEDINVTQQRNRAEAARKAQEAQESYQQAKQKAETAKEQAAALAATASKAPPSHSGTVPKQSMADSIAKMQADNNNFFGGL